MSLFLDNSGHFSDTTSEWTLVSCNQRFIFRMRKDYSFEITGSCSGYHTPDYGSVRVQNNHFHFPWPRIPNGVTRITFTVTNANRDVYIILSPSTEINDADSIPKIGKYKKHVNRIFAEIVLT